MDVYPVTGDDLEHVSAAALSLVTIFSPPVISLRHSHSVLTASDSGESSLYHNIGDTLDHFLATRHPTLGHFLGSRHTSLKITFLGLNTLGCQTSVPGIHFWISKRAFLIPTLLKHRKLNLTLLFSFRHGVRTLVR